MTRLGKSLVTDTEILSLDRLIAEIDAVDAEGVCALAAELLRTRAALGGRDRPERGALPRGARARDAGARRRRMRVLLNGYSPPSPETGKVGAILGPALVEAGHELVATEAEAEAMVDFTAPGAVVANILRAVEAGVPCVVGTSGWDTAEVDAAAQATPASRSSTRRTSRSARC